MKSRKFLVAVFAFVMVGTTVFAQSTDDGIKDLQYQKYRTAKQVLQQVIASKASDATPYYYLGLADLGLGRKDSARMDFQKGLQADPKSALNIVGMARLDVLDGKYDTAKQKLQQAFDLSDGRDFEVGRAILEATAQSPKADNAFAVNLMTQIKNNRHNRRKDFTADDFVALADAQSQIPGGAGDAGANYENAINADPKDAEAYDKYGELLLSARAYDNAVDNFNKAIQADPNYAPAYLSLYDYYRLRDLNKAQDNLQKYMQLADDKINAQENLVDLLYTQGQLQHDTSKYQQAIDKAQSIMDQVNPETKTRLYKLIAVSQLALGDSLDAKKNMDIYFSRHPDPKYAKFDYQTYGDILMKLNQDSLANSYYAKSIDADTTTDLSVLRSEAEDLRKQNNFTGAALYYKKIMKIAPQQANVDDYFWMGLSDFYANKYGSAKAIFDTMAQKFPEKANQQVAYYYLALTMMAQDTASAGPQGLAINPALKYLSLVDTADASKKQQLLKVYYYLSASYMDKGDYDNAAKYAGKLVSLDPTTAATMYSNLALIYSKQKDRDNATKYAQRALEINPNDQTAPQILNYYKQLDEYNEKMKKYNEEKKKANGGR